MQDTPMDIRQEVDALYSYVDYDKPPSGRCQFCGCTDARACRGGCSWADIRRTVCSTCMRFMALLIWMKLHRRSPAQ